MKLLHTMIRVYDLDKSLQFYCDGLGLEVKRRNDFPEKEFSLIFLGVPGESDGPEIELTFNHDRAKPYDRGDGYGHIAFAVPSIDALGEHLKELGIEWSWGPGKSPGGGGMAFLEDPDGYEVEILQRS
jgi:lactoylglutathione lyase